MPDDYSETTLPTLRDAIAESVASPGLQCTIIFHPCVERIGQSALLSCAQKEHILGRQAPLFCANSGTKPLPLEDPYISRHALAVTVEDDGITLCRSATASRCRVAGEELLQAELFIGNARLAAGVPLALSHTVVLMLRRTSVLKSPGPAALDRSLLGSSAVMDRLREEVMRAAYSDSDVLIMGETGVGKELVAQAIHCNSRRSDEPLVSVNMAAVPAGLASAVLFGNTKGAFTGADKARAGYFQEAQGGSLFLDEVGDTPEEVQPLLLRALQQREIQVVGGSARKVDVRVISATDAEIDGASCNFKSALRHRLAAIELRLPALAEHSEDIGELLMHFLSRACEREGRKDLLPAAHSGAHCLARWADLFHRFSCYHWPGNIRQLENFAGQVVVASDTQLRIPAPIIAEIDVKKSAVGAFGEKGLGVSAKPRKPMDITEVDFVKAMEHSLFEVAAVADELGVSRQSIYRRIDASARFRRASEIPMQDIQTTLASCGGSLGKAAFNLEISASALRQRLRSLGTPA